MKTIHTLALTTLAAAMAAGTAFAQQPTTPPTGVPQTQQTPPQTQQPHTQHGQAQAGMEARDHGSSDKPSYDELNTRGDGRVTRADLAAHPRLLEKFDDIDTAGDGTISRAEYDAWKSQKRDRDHATPQY
jgi:uncharacterized iron-regulated membrane protein